MRLPLVDLGSGKAEVMRVTEFTPQASADLRISNSTFHFTTNAGFSFQGNSRVDGFVPAGEGYIIKRDTVARAGAGLERRLENLSYGISLNFINGIGKNTMVPTSNQYSDYPYDFEPVDLSNLQVSSSFKLAKSTMLTATLTKGLKNVDQNNSFQAMVSSFDRLQEISNVGAGISLSQAL